MLNNTLPASGKKRTAAFLAACITLAFLLLTYFHLALSDTFFLTRADWTWIDTKFHLRGERPGSSEDILIVGMDDRALDKRSALATLITKIAEGGPRAIGFDVNFPEKDSKDQEGDRKLAESIRAANSVVLGVHLVLAPIPGPKHDSENLDPELLQSITEKGVFPAEDLAAGTPAPRTFIRAKQRQWNIPELTTAASSFGFANFHPDSDGQLRYQPQLIEYGGRLYPSLDLQVLRKYLDAPSPIIHYGSDGSIQMVEVGNYRIPTDRYGRIMVDYTGRRGSYPAISMPDVIEGRVDRNVFKGKIVLIGTPTFNSKDVVSTPFDPAIPGFLYRRTATPFGPEGIIDLALIVILGILLGYLLPKLNAFGAALFSIFILSGFAAINYWTFVRLHMVLSFVCPALSLTAASFVLITYNYFTDERVKKRTRQAFKDYLDPNVIEQVLAQPDLVQLSGDKRELSVLFSNIRSFTSVSEKMAAADVVHFLNHYFDKMQDIVFKNTGTLDKLIGDSVVCFWGAPMNAKDHALRSIVTALEMIQAVEDLRGTLVLPGGAKFDIAIGVNTGQMVFGNMGSQKRFSYTVIGDNVNLGSHLESLNKYYDTKIIISDSTFEAVRDVVLCRELDTIQVKGRSEAVTIYEPMGLQPLEFNRRRGKDRRGGLLTFRKRLVRALNTLYHGERRYRDRRLGSEQLLARPEHEEIKSMYEHALTLYRKDDLDGAEIGFDHVLSLAPNDGPACLMKDRIAKQRAKRSDEPQIEPIFKFEER
jgi:adenylate cyclase